MGEKVLSIFDEDGPIHKGELFKKMQSLDEDIVFEYIDGLRTQIDNLHAWRDIFSSVKSPSRCQTLIDELDEEKLEYLRQIVQILGRKDLLKLIQELLRRSLCLEPPSCGSKKISYLLETIMKVPLEKREEIGIIHGRISIEFRNFSELLLSLNRGLVSDEYLAKINDYDMDRMIELAEGLLKCAIEKSAALI